MPPSSPRLGFLTIAACLAAATSCSHDSYLVVTLLSDDTPFTGVGLVDVVVSTSAGGETKTLRFDARRQEISFSATMSKTLSIAFTPGQSGPVDLTVIASASNGTCMGTGSVMNVTIKKADVSPVTVVLRRDYNCPSPDGGTTDSGVDGVTFSGCDPAMPEATCPSNQTCFVNCSTKMGMCIAGGLKGPGESCTTANDCMPGTQCFDYSAVSGCAAGTRICLKFCSSDNQCTPGATGSGGATGGTTGAGGATGGGGTAGISGGAGAGGAAGGSGAGTAGNNGAAGAPGTGGTAVPAVVVSACRNPVACNPTMTTSYRTCTFACDPRGDGTTGCPAGLLCFLYRDPVAGKPDSPDCGCREPAPLRTKPEGEPCNSSAECAPGHICNMMGGAMNCRKLCKMSSPGDCTTPRACNALLNNPVFGVCVGM